MELEIGLTFENIQAATLYQLQNYVRKVIYEKSLEYLNKLKKKHTKVVNVKHEELKLQ